MLGDRPTVSDLFRRPERENRPPYMVSSVGDVNFGFSRTFDEDSLSPAQKDRESPGKRGSPREVVALDHRECGRAQFWCRLTSGWLGSTPQGNAPRSEASALGARWLLPARPPATPPFLVISGLATQGEGFEGSERADNTSVRAGGVVSV